MSNFARETTPRKKRRGLIEKKRRDKINISLAELRRLVPTANEKQSSAKLEKAEILQLTVDYLREIKRLGFDKLVARSHPSAISDDSTITADDDTKAVLQRDSSARPLLPTPKPTTPATIYNNSSNVLPSTIHHNPHHSYQHHNQPYQNQPYNNQTVVPTQHHSQHSAAAGALYHQSSNSTPSAVAAVYQHHLTPSSLANGAAMATMAAAANHHQAASVKQVKVERHHQSFMQHPHSGFFSLDHNPSSHVPQLTHDHHQAHHYNHLYNTHHHQHTMNSYFAAAAATYPQVVGDQVDFGSHMSTASATATPATTATNSFTQVLSSSPTSAATDTNQHQVSSSSSPSSAPVTNSNSAASNNSNNNTSTQHRHYRLWPGTELAY